MFIEQLRCDYDVSELFEEESILGPTELAADSGLYVDTISAVTGPAAGFYVLPSKCCRCGPRRPLLEETPE